MADTAHSLSHIYHIPVRLGQLQDLFEAPDFNPFVAQSDYLSGVERIFREIRRKQPKDAIRATIFLPPDRFSPELEPACAAAIHRTCDIQIEQIDDELASIRWEGIRSLLVGVLVWAGCLFLALSFGAMERLAEFPRLLISDGLIIVGWVALWYPAETLLYEWWLQNRDKNVYKRIKEIEIQVACMDDLPGSN